MSRRIITSLCLIYKPYPYFFIIPFIISAPSRQLSMGAGFSKACAGGLTGIYRTQFAGGKLLGRTYLRRGYQLRFWGQAWV